MALRNISASHVILTSGTIARITGSGIVDMVEAESRKGIAEMQAEDCVKLDMCFWPWWPDISQPQKMPNKLYKC